MPPRRLRCFATGARCARPPKQAAPSPHQPSLATLSSPPVQPVGGTARTGAADPTWVWRAIQGQLSKAHRRSGARRDDACRDAGPLCGRIRRALRGWHRGSLARLACAKGLSLPTALPGRAWLLAGLGHELSRPYLLPADLPCLPHAVSVRQLGRVDGVGRHRVPALHRACCLHPWAG